MKIDKDFRLSMDSKKHDIAALNQILKDGEGADKAEALKQWYTTSSDQAVKQSRNRIVDALLNLGHSGIRVINELGIIADSSNVGDSILQIRYYIATNNLDKALQFFRSLPKSQTRKRHVQLLLHAYADTGHWNTAVELFKVIVDSYPQPGVQAEDILPFLRPIDVKGVDAMRDRCKVLDLVLGQPIMMGTLIPDTWGIEKITEEAGELRKLDFTTDQLEQLTANLNMAFREKGRSLPALDLTKHYDYVIDGANVLFYAERDNTVHGYRRISRMLKALRATVQVQERVPSILLVLHERHFKSRKPDALKEIKFWRSLKHVDICQTPQSLNDDYYSLLNALPRPECLLVTNDKFRDHIYKLSSKDHNLDLIGAWRQEKVVEYTMQPKGGPVTLLMPPPFSYRVQKSDKYYYLPTSAPSSSSSSPSFKPAWYRIPVH